MIELENIQSSKKDFYSNSSSEEEINSDLEDFEKLRLARYILANKRNINNTNAKLPRIKTFDFEPNSQKKICEKKNDKYKTNLFVKIRKKQKEEKNILEKIVKKSATINLEKTEKNFEKKNFFKDNFFFENNKDNYLMDFSENVLYETEKMFKEKKDLIFLRFFSNEENINLKKFENKYFSVVNFINKFDNSYFSNFLKKNPKKIYDKYFYQKNKKNMNFAFSTNFFQGNLWKVFQKKNNDFNLYLFPDTNTFQIGHWFLFEFSSFNYSSKKTIFKIKNFSNPHENLENIKLNISYAIIDNFEKTQKNFEKKDLIFQKKLLVNSIKKNKDKDSYTLIFEFPIKKNKTYIFSFDKPIQKNKITSFLNFKKNKKKKNLNKVKIIQKQYGKSILKINLFYKKIFLKKNKNLKKKKKAIIIIQGLVPSDTPTITFLEEFQNRIKKISSNEEKFLLQNYDIYIFPFINIDGYIFGNSYSNLSGNFLAEKNVISKHTTPELFYLIKEIKKISNLQEISIFCSLRSSIAKKGHFLTTLEKKNNFKFNLEIPLLFSDLCSNFNIEECGVIDDCEDFKNSHLLSKINFLTNCKNVFEFFISGNSNGNGYFFDEKDFRNLGKDFLNCLSIFCSKEVNLSNQDIFLQKEIKSLKPKFDWKFISSKKSKFEITKSFRSFSLVIKNAKKFLKKGNSEQNNEETFRKEILSNGSQNNLDFLTVLFSKKKHLPNSEKAKNLKHNKKFILKKQIEEKRKKSLERKNNLFKNKLYKIKHSRNERTKGYNYVLRKNFTNYDVFKKNNSLIFSKTNQHNNPNNPNNNNTNNKNYFKIETNNENFKSNENNENIENKNYKEEIENFDDFRNLEKMKDIKNSGIKKKFIDKNKRKMVLLKVVSMTQDIKGNINIHKGFKPIKN